MTRSSSARPPLAAAAAFLIVCAFLPMPSVVVAAAAAPATADSVGAAGTPDSPALARLKVAALAAEPSTALRLTPLARTFKAQDGSTDLVVTLQVETKDIRRAGSGDPDLTLYARLLRLGAPDAKPVEITDPETFTLFEEAGDPFAIYGFSISLPPGKYELRAGAEEAAAAAAQDTAPRTGTARAEIDLPDYTGEALTLSSVTCSYKTAQASSNPDDPFHFGAIRLIPRATARLEAGEDFGFYYQVYGAKDDPATGKPQLDVSYQFEKKESGAWKPLTRAPLALPGQHEATLGYSLASAMLARFPAGDCRVVITVKDTIGSSQTATTLEFTLIR